MSEKKEYDIVINTDDKGVKKLTDSVGSLKDEIKDTQKETEKIGDESEKVAKKSKNAFQSFGGMVSGSLTNAFKSFGDAIKAHPILTIIAVVTGVIGVFKKLMKPFQPLLDWLSDKIAYIDGLVSGFIAQLSAMGDIIKAVFSGDFASASEKMGEMGRNIQAAAEAQEAYNKALRDYEMQQTLNDLTSSETLIRQAELKRIFEDGTESVNKRIEALKAYNLIIQGEANDDYENKLKLHNKLYDNIISKIEGLSETDRLGWTMMKENNSDYLNNLKKNTNLTNEQYTILSDSLIELNELKAKSSQIEADNMGKLSALQKEAAANATARREAERVAAEERKAAEDEAMRKKMEQDQYAQDTHNRVLDFLKQETEANKAAVAQQAKDYEKSVQKKRFADMVRQKEKEAQDKRDADAAKAKAKMEMDMNLNSASTAMGAIESIAQAADADAGAMKAISVVEAGINTAKGVTSALAGPVPLNFITAALVGAAGAVQISAILNTKLPKRSKSGGGGVAASRPNIASVSTPPEPTQFEEIYGDGIETNAYNVKGNDKNQVRAVVVLSDIDEARNENDIINNNTTM